MPPCKNDKSRTYKGTEPSPKGIGYCAHTETINSKKKEKMVIYGLFLLQKIKQKDGLNLKMIIKIRVELYPLNKNQFVKLRKNQSKIIYLIKLYIL